jgi:hypothetical protein
VPAIPPLSYGANTPLTLAIVLDDERGQYFRQRRRTGHRQRHGQSAERRLCRGQGRVRGLDADRNQSAPLQQAQFRNLAAPVVAEARRTNGQPGRITDRQSHRQRAAGGVGPQIIKINPGTCVDVKADAPGFVIETYRWCNQPNSPEPPISETPPMLADESYQASEQSDQANVNITIEPGPDRTEDAVWNVISSIVLSYFDILENSDRETGYLRTGWQVKA